ncbi:toMV susceptible protein tm-2-like isoform X2 [Carex rostrata]
MDTSLLSSIIDMLSHPAVNNFLSENIPGIYSGELVHRLMVMRYTTFKGLPQEEKQAQIESMQLLARKVTNLMSEIVGRKAGSITRDDLEKDWREIANSIMDMFIRSNYGTLQLEGEVLSEFSCDHIERIENMLLETVDCSNCKTLNEKQSQVLLLKKAIPVAMHTPTEEQNRLLLEINSELESLPLLICKACVEQPLSLLLIGGLLSFKPISYDTWNRVKDDLVMIKEPNNCVTSNNTWHIINYCYNDLPNSLKLCFLYFASYPIGNEIPATSLSHIWIAEGFVTPEVEEWIEKGLLTPEEEERIANKYLEQLVQRSLVCVSKRSLLGTIKSFRLPRQVHEFAIQQSYKDYFMAANPDQEKVQSMLRLAIHHDNKKQYTKEDPMPTLGRLQSLKLLRLQDEAYTGNQMLCSANGFPQLQFLKLKKLENLVNWVVEPNAMSQLTTLRVVQCGKLNHPSNLTVTISDIDD